MTIYFQAVSYLLTAFATDDSFAEVEATVINFDQLSTFIGAEPL